MCCYACKENKKLINNIIRGKDQLNWCRDYQCPFPQKFIGKQNGRDLTVHLLNFKLKSAYKSLSCISSTTLNLTLPCFRERNKEGQLWNVVVLQPEVEMASIAT